MGAGPFLQLKARGSWLLALVSNSDPTNNVPFDSRKKQKDIVSI